MMAERSGVLNKNKKARVAEESEDVILKACRGKSKKKKENCGDFLFAEEMKKGYLNSGGGSESNRVGIDILRGKWVGIVFSKPLGGSNQYKVLHQVYKEIREKNGDVFELVYVAKLDDDDEEEHPFQLSVPFIDMEWRKRLCNAYNCGYVGELVLFDPQGHPLKLNKFKVCYSMMVALTQIFGSALYPFTVARERQLVKEGEAALRSPNPFEALFSLGGGGGGGGDLISNDGHTKVPMYRLRDKIVGLYFFTNRRTRLSRLLLNVYKQQLLKGHNFEIIFINVSRRGGYTDEKTFLRKLKRMPWLALPFNDERVWPLYSLFVNGGYDNFAHLTIIGPSHNPFVECNGFPFIKEYGMDAYPFNLDAAVNAEIRRQTTQLKLSDFFEAMGVDSLLCKSEIKGRQTTTISILSFLQNNNQNNGGGVLFYIAKWSKNKKDQEPPHKIKGGSRLLDLYHDKLYHGSFKVVFLSLDSDETSFNRHFDTMPTSWLAVPLFWEVADNDFFENFLLTEEPHIIAFDGPSGCLLKMGHLKSFGAHDGTACAFPFITHQDFFQFVKSHLPVVRGWCCEPGYCASMFTVRYLFHVSLRHCHFAYVIFRP